MDKEELLSHVDKHYFVISQFKQSYYDLFASADISWKKSHSCQPKVRFKVSQKKSENPRVFGSEPS